MDRRKRLGAHYTPEALAGFVVRRALGAARAGPLRVLDPACGDGELLAAVARARPGAELVGFDLDQAAVEAARLRLPSAVVERGDFTELGAALAAGSFDLVVTNPPYVRTQVLGGAASGRLAQRFGLRGRIDLTHPFVAMTPRLLREGGVLGLLCSNRFLSTRAGGNVRELLSRDFAVREVYDLGDTRLFTAAVLPALVVAVRGGAAGDARFVSVYSSDHPAPGGDLFAALTGDGDSRLTVGGRGYAVSVGTLVRGRDQPWRLSTPDRERRHRRIAERTWRTVGEVARIRVGIKTTADPVFIGDHWDGLPPERRPEPELLRPLLTHADVRAWAPPAAPRLRVLYPYLDRHRRQVVDLAAHPGAAAYLADHRERLESREYLIAAGREWFEIWVPHRPSRWREPKVVFPDISPEPRFTIDRSGAVVNGDCYWVPVSDLGGEDLAHLLLGVANSAFGVRFYDEVCGNRLYAGRRRWITQYVARLPLPDPGTPAAKEITSLARLLVGADDPALRRRLDEAVDSAFGS